MMTSATLGRGLVRETSEEAETCVYVRPAMPWDRVMVLQIMRDLEPEKRMTPLPQACIAMGAAALQPQPKRPNVFLTPLPSDPPPPWARAGRSGAKSSVRKAAARSAGQRVVASREAPREASRELARRPALRRDLPPRAVARDDETQVRPRWRHQAPRRMMLPWLLFLMYFLIAFGVGQDRKLRTQMLSEGRTAASQTMTAAQSSAMWLWRFVSGITT